MRALALVMLLGCSSSEFEAPSTNVTGAWAGTATNASSSCPGDFRVGETSPVNANITNDGKSLSIKVEGSVGFWVNLLIGADTFTGTIEGSTINATLLGSKDLKDGLCTYRITATMAATTDGKKMNGTVTYKPNVVSGDCSAWKDCARTQSFAMNKS